MKIVSLFTKAPGYKRFAYKPRFWDQKAEERKEREERIRQEIALEKGQQNPTANDYRSRMQGAFHSARRRTQTSSGNANATLLRLGVFLFLAVFLFAYMTWGKWALYSLFLFLPLYIYYKFKNRK